MNFNAKSYSYLLLVLSSLLGLESTFAQTGNDTIPSSTGTRDTIVIIKRDTIIVLQKEITRIIEEAPERSETNERPLSRGRGGGRRQEDSDVVERRRQMRIEKRREYEEWYATQPIVRTGKSWGCKFYPSALGQMDFPSVKFGIEQTINGDIGLQANLGILIPPTETWSFGFGQDPGESRYGIRGVDLGISGRYYFADKRNSFPFYLEAEVSYSIAPIEIGLWSTSPDGTFQEFVEAPVNGQRLYFGALVGWELRTKEGLLLDLATGIRVGTKSIRSSNPEVQALITDRYWNLNENGVVGLFSIVTRIGIGYGKWSPNDSKAKSHKTSSKKKKRRKRR